jgi:EmrB/QacA subfamily drug resistance transporter
LSSYAPPTDEPLRLQSARGRWTLTATIVGSGMVFLDGTVVNVALPAIERDLDASLAGLQWVVTGYLLTLGSLLLFGGALGDLRGRRKVFAWGLALFTAASVLCALAPTLELLIAARLLQGAGGAFLVPQSLAIVSAAFAPQDRGRAIGLWSGLSGISTAIGPFVGGYLVDAASWRWAFLLNVPLGAVTAWCATRMPETRDPDAAPKLDVAGAASVTVGLAGVVYALIEGPVRGFTDRFVVVAGVGGVILLVTFLVIERRSSSPMLPLSLFRSRRFTGANLTTVAVYAALGGAFFFVGLQLQTVLGYSALEAGVAFLPITLLLAIGSGRIGGVAQRHGPRSFLTAGPLTCAVGFVALSRVAPGDDYWTGVFPGVLLFGLGLMLTVAPLVGAMLMSVPDRLSGTASGVNNAVSRVAQLVSIALLPAAAGLGGVAVGSEAFSEGYARAMVLTAALCALGGVIAWATIGPEPETDEPQPVSDTTDSGAGALGEAGS